MDALRILIVEDAAADVELALRELRWAGFTPAVRAVETGAAGAIAEAPEVRRSAGLPLQQAAARARGRSAAALVHRAIPGAACAERAAIHGMKIPPRSDKGRAV